MKETAKMVTAWMEENGVNKVKLAELLGVSEALVRGMLSGERRITSKRIDALSKITGYSANELLGIEENNFAGYTVMLRGGSKQLTAKQESSIMDVALLANDYERLKTFIN